MTIILSQTAQHLILVKYFKLRLQFALFSAIDFFINDFLINYMVKFSDDQLMTIVSLNNEFGRRFADFQQLIEEFDIVSS